MKPEDKESKFTTYVVMVAAIVFVLLLIASYIFDPSALAKATDIFAKLEDLTRGVFVLVIVLVIGFFVYRGATRFDEARKQRETRGKSTKSGIDK